MSYLPGMPHPTRRHMLEIVELPEGTAAPEGATWVNLSPVIGGCWCLKGNIPVPNGVMFDWGEYERIGEAIQAATDFALQQQIPLLYVEIDARRCD